MEVKHQCKNLTWKLLKLGSLGYTAAGFGCQSNKNMNERWCLSPKRKGTLHMSRGLSFLLCHIFRGWVVILKRGAKPCFNFNSRQNWNRLICLHMSTTAHHATIFRCHVLKTGLWHFFPLTWLKIYVLNISKTGRTSTGATNSAWRKVESVEFLCIVQSVQQGLGKNITN